MSPARPAVQARALCPKSKARGAVMTSSGRWRPFSDRIVSYLTSSVVFGRLNQEKPGVNRRTKTMLRFTHPIQRWRTALKSSCRKDAHFGIRIGTGCIGHGRGDSSHASGSSPAERAERRRLGRRSAATGAQKPGSLHQADFHGFRSKLTVRLDWQGSPRHLPVSGAGHSGDRAERGQGSLGSRSRRPEHADASRPVVNHRDYRGPLRRTGRAFAREESPAGRQVPIHLSHQGPSDPPD